MREEDNEINFALLVFGNLGKSAGLSLESIWQINPQRVCVAADNSGMDWINNHTPAANRSSLCFHSVPIEVLNTLGISLSEFPFYQEFGKESFVKLTAFKWLLLHDALSKHGSQLQIIFSDLDVLWLKSPNPNIFSADLYSQCFAVIQEDTFPTELKHYFCTGIMYWQNSIESLIVLDLIFKGQLNNITSGKMLNDEKTFNEWLITSPYQENFKPLSKSSFVIGHRFFRFLSSRNKTFRNVVAFHANYVVGESAKFRRLNTVALRQNNDWKWVLNLSLEIFKKFKSKIT